MEKNTTAPVNSIPLREKFAYLLGTSSHFPISVMVSGYIIYFYTEVVGLPMAAVGTMMLIARLLDAITDPMSGFLIDHLPRTKWGRYRPYLLIGTIICLINFVLLWKAPVLATEAKLTAAYITFLLYGISIDLAAIPANAMISVEATNSTERMSLSYWKTIAILLGSVMAFAMPIILDSAETLMEGFDLSMWIVVAFAFITALAGTIGMRERVSPSKESTNYRLRDLAPIVTYRPVLVIMLLQFAYTIASSVSMTTYYFTYIIPNLSLVSLVTLVYFVSGLPAFIFCRRLTLRFGRKKVFCVAMLVAAGGAFLRLIDPYSVALVMLANVFAGFYFGVSGVIANTLQADSVSLVEQKKGVRAEGAIMSINELVIKAGGAIGGALPTFFLAAAGYREAVNNVQQAQPDSALQAIIITTIVLPQIFILTAAAVYWFGFNFTDEQVEEISLALEEKRGNANKA